MQVINVILSGGVGSRLWPLSRKARPKQYIPLFGNDTLFKMCVLRNKEVTQKLIVVGGIDNYQLSRADIVDVGIENFVEIIESVPRNTAASVAFAALAAQPDDILLVTPSDHVINGTESYKNAIYKAIEYALNNNIVTFGCIPTRPETGYGYIEYNDYNDVVSFKEKPNKEIAQYYLESSKYLWNSGMFCFKASVFLEELKNYAPEVYDSTLICWQQQKDGFLPEEAMQSIPSISIDYAVMEHSQKIKVVPFTFDWSDLGSFEALWEYLEKNENTIDAKKPNLVIGSNKHIEFIGLENLIYVETEDAVLIMPKNMSQDVKKVYERLEKENPDLL